MPGQPFTGLDESGCGENLAAAGLLAAPSEISFRAPALTRKRSVLSSNCISRKGSVQARDPKTSPCRFTI
jgi:hypothetical protein